MRPVVVGVLLATACVTVRPQLLVPPGKYTAVPVDSVRVFTSGDEIAAQGYQWESVAILFADAARAADDGAILRRLRAEAGQLGANGIIMGEIREPGFGGQYRKMQVPAVRWWRRPP